ncbi:MAG: type II secretion system F family protein [Roseburia sp.]|nr:type II secretion system F family protein [Roseburia sp.]MCM1278066.1 type II secretion system F family protein [Robinsoniella sp.]
MATYSYIAIDKAGKQVKSSIEADTLEKARSIIKNDGLTPMELKEQGLLDKDVNLAIFKKKVKTRDLSLFCRQFVSMHRAGVTILESLRMLTEQTENDTLREAVQETYLGVQKGESLAKSMAKSPKVFPGLLIHMVTAGEASGSLDIAFERMAEQFEKSAKLQSMIKKAMIYPIVVAIVAVVVVIVMLTFVVPNFIGMFADMDIDMPGITLAVIAASDFMKARWYIVVMAIIAIVAFVMWFKRQPFGEALISKAAIKIPLFGDITVKSSSAKLARTLSTMLAAGIPMPEAVEITAGTINNLFYKEALMNAKTDVMQGVPLSQPLERCGLFPPMVYHMTRIGEETGNVEDMLDKMADYYEEEVETATQSLMAALEPALIIVMAGVCGVIIGAVMAPMAAMYEGLDNL